eukprot:5786196-Prymnesium_polylepis.1
MSSAVTTSRALGTLAMSESVDDTDDHVASNDTDGHVGTDDDYPHGNVPVLITAQSMQTMPSLYLPEVVNEAREIQHAYGGAAHADIKRDVTVAHLGTLLEGRKAWYFPGHGNALLQGENVLAFVSRGGNLETVSIETLVGTVRPHVVGHGGSLQLIVLTGCCTAKFARALVDCANVPCVVCWETELVDEAGYVFGSSFASALAEDDSPSVAFDKAQTAVTTITEFGRLDTGRRAFVQKYQLADPRDPKVDHKTGRLPAVPPAESGRIAAGVPKLFELKPGDLQEGLFSKRQRFVADMLPGLEAELRQQFLEAPERERQQRQPQLDFERRVVREVIQELSEWGGHNALVPGRTVIFLGLPPGFTPEMVLKKFEPKFVVESDDGFGHGPMRPATEADSVFDHRHTIHMLSNERAVLTFRDKEEAETGCYYKRQELRTRACDPRAFIVSEANVGDEDPVAGDSPSITPLQDSLIEAFRVAAKSASDHEAAFFNDDDNFSFVTASIIAMRQDASELASAIKYAIDGDERPRNGDKEMASDNQIDGIRMLRLDRMRMPIERDEDARRLRGSGAALLAALAHVLDYTGIDLSDGSVGSIAEARLVVRCLMTCTNLRYIDLSRNSLGGPSGGVAVADLIRSHPNLEHLSLRECQLGSFGTGVKFFASPDAFMAIADALHHAPRLASLNLADARGFCVDTPWLALADALRTNSNL